MSSIRAHDRPSPQGLQDSACRWVEALGYSKLVTFSTVDERRLPVYHTNVMMAIGTSVAIVCGESVPDASERRHLFVRSHAPPRSPHAPGFHAPAPSCTQPLPRMGRST